MEQFDVLGLPLEEALSKMESLGSKTIVLHTKPLKGEAIDGISRVVKKEYTGEEWTLTVCNVPDIYR